MGAIARCRTEAMGFVEVVCDECGGRFPLLRSCRNRSCPQCGAGARAKWLEAREREILPVSYFHVVFTVPEVLNTIALYCPEVFYAALLRAAGQTLLDVGLTKLNARLGALTILHTWGQNLSLHPHAHCVVPGGGFSADGQRWIEVPNPSYLLPVRVLMRRFRTLLCQSLRTEAREGGLQRLPANVSPQGLIANAAAQEWIVYAKPPFGGAEQVLEYLSRYTHRVAISNRRILSFSEGKVTFEWRDYADGKKMKQSTLEAGEFLRRFLMHVLPARFVRIRYFGFLANRHRTENIERARNLIGRMGELRFRKREPHAILCPACYALRLVKSGHCEVATVGLRSPPAGKAA
jgi:Putative transposase/Transposase zinc-binding domain